jgi:hypothetical protein
VQKVVIIIVVGISFFGCSVLKTKENITLNEGKATNAEEIASYNISTINFAFARIEISVEGSGKKQKLLGNLRYISSGKYLISLRNNTGIEGVRIYIDKDTILANDRINRKTYYGSSSHLYEKYGISPEYLPVLIGDLIIDEVNKKKNIKCKGGSTEISGLIGLNEIYYVADCSKRKVVKAEFGRESNKYPVDIKFWNFRKIGNKVYPVNILVDDLSNKNKIAIEIKKAEIYNGAEINFIPGNNYELILLQ